MENKIQETTFETLEQGLAFLTSTKNEYFLEVNMTMDPGKIYEINSNWTINFTNNLNIFSPQTHFVLIFTNFLSRLLIPGNASFQNANILFENFILNHRFLYLISPNKFDSIFIIFLWNFT